MVQNLLGSPLPHPEFHYPLAGGSSPSGIPPCCRLTDQSIQTQIKIPADPQGRFMEGRSSEVHAVVVHAGDTCSVA